MLKTAAFGGVLLVLICAPLARGAEAVTVETVVSGLDDARGVAIRPGGSPESYEIFIAEGGARRVIKLASNRPNDSTEVITNFPILPTRERSANPVCLLFLDREHLIAGVDGTPPTVHLYKLSDADGPLTADQSSQKVTVDVPKSAQSIPGSCFALARTRPNDYVGDMLLVAAGGYDPLSGLWKTPIRAGTLGEMTALKKSEGVGDPKAVAVSEQGYVVMADRIRSSVERRLIFLNPTNGRSAMSLQTKFRHLVGLTYSPKTGNFYALGSESATLDEAGVFRIDDAGQSASNNLRAVAVKIADVHWPTALAFGPDGALYVTAASEAAASGSSDGGLIKLTGEL